MNKKEKLELETAIKEREEYKAMLYAILGIEDVKPDVMPPSSPFYKERVTGWGFNSCSQVITEMWTNSMHHGLEGRTNSAYQNSRELYSTKELAKKAMIAEIKIRMAKELSKL